MFLGPMPFHRLPSVPRAPRRRARALAAALGVAAVAAFAAIGGCSLGNVSADACTKNSECEAAFGLGSECQDGYCSPVTNQGCNKKDANGNACYSCPPTTDKEFHTGCTDAQCAPFDPARITKANPDGSLPPLP